MTCKNKKNDMSKRNMEMLGTEEMDINVEIIKHSSMIVLSNDNIKRKYLGYTVNEAKKIFKEEIKSMNCI